MNDDLVIDDEEQSEELEKLADEDERVREEDAQYKNSLYRFH